MRFLLIFGNFWWPVVNLVTFISNLSIFERNPKKTQKNRKNPENSKTFKKSKIQKNTKKSIKTQKIVKIVKKKIWKSWKISTSHFFSSKNLKILKTFFFANSTRALQSSPFQISGGVVWALRTNEGRRTKEILVSNIRFQCWELGLNISYQLTCILIKLVQIGPIPIYTNLSNWLCIKPR